MEMAIREYAPGAEVVMDGRVYQSAGVTLNWHIPAGVENANEVQALRHVWRCRQCGVTGDSISEPAHCPQCEGSLEKEKYLEPAGFAVDIRHHPHNNVGLSDIHAGTPTLDQLSDARLGIVRRSAVGTFSVHRFRPRVFTVAVG